MSVSPSEEAGVYSTALLLEPSTKPKELFRSKNANTGLRKQV